jgi:hypothetical protein
MLTLPESTLALAALIALCQGAREALALLRQARAARAANPRSKGLTLVVAAVAEERVASASATAVA